MRGLTLGEATLFDQLAEELGDLDSQIRAAPAASASLCDRRHKVWLELRAIAEAAAAELPAEAYRRHLEAYVASGDPDHLAAMLEQVPYLD